MRKIIHIDMDAFFASVEQRNNPSLRGLPIAVGHAERRGVVAAASYEARRYGVRSAMPSTKALRLCPSLIFVESHFDVYKQVSAEMHEIFHEYTDVVEPISLDEAFLDVTVNKPAIPLGVDIAKEIKAKIRSRLHLTASAGVSYNKFLAKVASDYRKPDGLCTIHPSQALDFIHRLPVESFWGAGPVTSARMRSLGIENGEQLGKCSLEMLRANFGKAGDMFYNFARGIDNRPVQPVRTRKSVGCETTLENDLSSVREIGRVISELADELATRIRRASFNGNTITLKVRFSTFEQRTRSLTIDTTFVSQKQIMAAARELMVRADVLYRPVRLLGLSVNSNESGKTQKGFNPLQLSFDFDEL